MRKTCLVAAIILLVGALFIPWSGALAAADGYYTLTETASIWDGTDANRLKPTTADYNYTYGDESSVTYTLPWTFTFYGQTYSQITADTNGNVWFASTGSAHSFNLATTGRGPVIAAWNNDLSSQYYGGVFIQHKTNPERVVIQWQTETYIDEGEHRLNNVEMVLFPYGTVRLDYLSFDTTDGNDFGSGVSKGDGTKNLSLTTNVAPVPSLSGHSYIYTVNISKTCIGVFSYGHWFLDKNGNGVWDAGVDGVFNFGTPGDIPVTGDWDGSGRTKIGVFRSGQWYLDLNGNGVWDGTPTDGVNAFGTPGEVPVTGKWQ